MRFLLPILFLSLASRSYIHAITASEAEGLFEIQIVCEDRTNPSCQELNRKARLSLIRTDDTLAASIGYPEVSVVRYSFISNHPELTDGRYVGEQMVTSSASAQFAEVSMDFIHQDQDGKHYLFVKGVIRDARFVKDVEFSGVQTVSLHTLKPQISNSNPVISPENTEGRFLAKGKDRQWVITIRKALSNSSKSNDYLAETSDLGSPDGTELASGERRYFRSIPSAKNDSLEFVASLHTPGTFIKWVIWATPERLRSSSSLKGFFYSSTGIFSNLTLEAI